MQTTTEGSCRKVNGIFFNAHGAFHEMPEKASVHPEKQIP